MGIILPGIIEQDSVELERKVALVAPFSEWIQINIGDETLFTVKTPHTFPFIKTYTANFFEAHLLVAKPETYVKHLVADGFKRIIAHVESYDPREFLAEARTYEGEIGLAIDTETALEDIEPFLEELDIVLVMTAPTGVSGQPFEESAIAKIRAIHRNFPELPIEVEGGMNETTVKAVVEAGATHIVSTSYLFTDEKRIGEAMTQLVSIAYP
jgi:ribulose-phosphate 3-epimerase